MQQGTGIPTAKRFFTQGELEFNRGHYQEAARQLSEAIRIDPQHINALLLRGQARVKIKQGKAGMKDLARAIELDPNNPELYVTRGNIYVTWKYRRSASKDFKTAADLYQGQGNIRQAQHYAKWSSDLVAQADAIDAADRAADAARRTCGPFLRVC